jgi:hypothetical protein
MLQLSMRTLMAGTASMLVLMFVIATPASAKCISLPITVQGEIQDAADDLTVKVEVLSATKGDPVRDVRQEFSVDHSHFRVSAWFNTTSNVIRNETCNRKPRLVIVKLMKGNQILDQQQLKILTDFRQTKDGGFDLLKPLALRAHVEK